MTQPEALALSLLIEVPCALLVARALAPGREAKVLPTAVAATLLTHPLVWPAFLLTIPRWGYAPACAVLETTVTAVEATLYGCFGQLPLRDALVTALAANGASFGAGLLIHAVAGS